MIHIGGSLAALRNEMRPKVVVVIVNWNGDRFLERCLSALLVQTVKLHEIIGIIVLHLITRQNIYL